MIRRRTLFAALTFALSALVVLGTSRAQDPKKDDPKKDEKKKDD